ncbi:MAG TPA: hypothetical protein VFP69_11735 [Streptomyces sp.]|nr:hypothetical protein [Streptomyces sp.]
MTAVDESSVPAGAGKCTRGQTPVGEATRACLIRDLTLPHLPYADAVVAALDAAGVPPAVVESGLRDLRAPVLFVRAVWPAGSEVLAEGVRDRGLTLAWSHVTGWSVHDADGTAALLGLDVIAAPELVADAARCCAGHGVDAARRLPPASGRWADAVYLDIAAARVEERS